MWKILLFKETQPHGEAFVITGECNRCCQCCICWFYDIPDQPAEILPRKGWCAHLDIEAKACRIWEQRPEGCRNFPTVRDFEMGNVLESCGFKLVERR